MKSILLIGNTTSKGALRLKEEAQKQGVTFDLINPQKTNMKDIPHTYDVYYFRGIKNSEQECHMLAKALRQEGKRIVERVLVDDVLPNDKLVPESANGSYIVPTTRIMPVSDTAAFATLTYPIMLKGMNSSKGKQVFIVSSAEELPRKAEGLGPDVIIQEYIPIQSDIRILIIGDKVMGAVEYFKKNPTDSITRARGGLREAITPSPAMIAAAMEAKKLKGLEIAGVDIFIYENRLYIIEVNASPNFIGFEKRIETNVAAEILNCLQQ